MSAVKVDSKTDRKYFIQYCKDSNWIFSQLDSVQGGFDRTSDAEAVIDDVMVFHNDFSGFNYRILQRTTIILDEPRQDYNSGW